MNVFRSGTSSNESPRGRGAIGKFLAILVTLAWTVGLSSPAYPTGSSVSYDFNTAGQLTAEFDSYVSSGTIVQSTAGGIGNSGAINVSSNTANAVFASKSKYSMGGQGSVYTFTSYMKSVGNSGYSGVGFTSLAPSSSNAGGTPYRPTDALGVSVHGGGFVFHVGPTDYYGSWGSDNSGITTVKKSTISDLLNSGSPDQWYKVLVIIEQTSSTLFEMSVEVWSANADGTLIRPNEADAIFKMSNLTNSTLLSAPSISSYINFSGYRVTHFDNYQVDLQGSTVIAAGNPVVLTTSTAEGAGEITVNGNVTSDGGAAVTDRGFVYGASSEPTIAGSKVSVGTGTGSFSGTTPTLSAGTYYVRAFATNSAGTSYGTESTVVIASPGDSTAPTLSSSTPANGDSFVSNAANLVLNFSENVSVATGNISIVETANPSSTIDIDVTSDQVTTSASAVTINPSQDLKLGTSYHVLIPSGAIVDGAGNAYAGITQATTLAFTTAKVPTSGLTVALDAAMETSYTAGTSGATWTDLSGASNNLTLYNTPTFSSTAPRSFGFASASSEYGDFAAIDLLNNSAYTKLVWFKPTGFGSVNNLFSSGVTNAHAFWGGGLNANCTAGSGDNLAAGHNGSWWEVESSECMEVQWQLGVVTFSNVDGWKLYRNGVLVGQDPDKVEISLANLGYTTQVARFGTGNYFDGLISQVYLYDRALTATEINAIYEATSDYFGHDLNTVTFNASGGSVDTPTLRTNASDGTVTLRLPEKQNASFLGWYTQAEGGTRVGGAGQSYNPNGSDVTLFAQWDNSYTVTYSAGTNATGAPATASYLDSTGALTLPTPERSDYVFEGWYSAPTGGTKIGNAGASYTPSADVTLHGRWTQASLVGIDPSDLSEVNSTTIVNGVGSSNTLTIGSSSVTVNIPANALPSGSVVKVYSVANNERAQEVLTSESEFVNSMVVAWTASDTAVPVATSALTMVIVDSSIKAGAKVYSIVGDTSTLLATATQDGTVTVSFTTDPLVAIANPTVTSGSGGSSGGSSGGGSGSSGGGSAPVVTQPPVVSEPGAKKELDNKPVIPELANGRPTQSVLVDGQPSQIEIREIQSSTALEVEGDDWRLEISARSSTGIQRPVADSIIRLLTGDRAVFSGTGMAPNTIFNVYVFSEPELIGQISTNEDGEFSADLPLPAGLPLGSHTLQLGSLSATGETITVSVPIEISGKVNAGSFKGVVALYAKGFLGQRLSAKVGNDWVVVEKIAGDFIRVTEAVNKKGQALLVKIFINRDLLTTIDLVTR